MTSDRYPAHHVSDHRARIYGGDSFPCRDFDGAGVCAVDVYSHELYPASGRIFVSEAWAN